MIAKITQSFLFLDRRKGFNRIGKKERLLSRKIKKENRENITRIKERRRNRKILKI
jgi:hypothetical protein